MEYRLSMSGLHILSTDRTLYATSPPLPFVFTRNQADTNAVNPSCTVTGTMSENIPESIPTSSDKHSHRPTKRQAITPSSAQSTQLSRLFANPTREINTSAPLTGQSTLAPPPELVTNVQGSSAGAGSGEFHVYKASRRREYERLRVMEAESEAEKTAAEFARRKEEMRELDASKTEKNRAKREKARARKMGAKSKTAGVDGEKVGVDKGQGKVRANVDVHVTGKEDEDADNDDGRVPGNDATEEGIVIHDDDD